MTNEAKKPSERIEEIKNDLIVRDNGWMSYKFDPTAGLHYGNAAILKYLDEEWEKKNEKTDN